MTSGLPELDFKRRQWRHGLWAAGLALVLIAAQAAWGGSVFGVPPAQAWRFAFLPPILLLIVWKIVDSFRFGMVWTRFGTFRRDERPMAFYSSVVLIVLFLSFMCGAVTWLALMARAGGEGV